MLFSFRPWVGFFVACVALAVQLFGFAMMAFACRPCAQRQCAAPWRWQATKKCVGRRQHRRRLVCRGFLALAQALAVPVGRAVSFHCNGWYLFTAALNVSIPICLYFSVVDGYLWPAKLCTRLKSCPCFNRFAITLCRIVCAFTFLFG